jgi:hypothetical protein
MRFLTLTQPWATLMAIGAKRIETRSWSTPYRGWVGIHAARTFPRWAREACADSPFREVLAAHRITTPDQLPLGSVLAAVSLQYVFPTEHPMTRLKLTSQELAFGDYEPGRRAWWTDALIPLREPIPATGHLGLWSDADLAERVWRNLRCPTEPK